MRILFICMGNICRSPTAAAVFRHLLQQRTADVTVEVDSAGTHDYHVGEAPDRRAMAAARRRGFDMSGLRARQIEDSDFERFDLLLAMDRENVAELRRRAPAAYHPRIRLFMEYAPQAHSRVVPDPYYGGSQGFEEVLDLLEQASAGLIEEVLKRSR